MTNITITPAGLRQQAKELRETQHSIASLLAGHPALMIDPVSASAGADVESVCKVWESTARTIEQHETAEADGV